MRTLTLALLSMIFLSGAQTWAAETPKGGVALSVAKTDKSKRTFESWLKDLKRESPARARVPINWSRWRPSVARKETSRPSFTGKENGPKGPWRRENWKTSRRRSTSRWPATRKRRQSFRILLRPTPKARSAPMRTWRWIGWRPPTRPHKS